MSSTPLREALAAAQELVDKCHHTSFAKVDRADIHGACAQCIAQHTQRAVEAEREACAKWFEQHMRGRWYPDEIAAAIRARAEGKENVSLS